MLILISIFVVVSCKPEPEPTKAPEAGEIPAIPNEVTPIESVGEEEKEALESMMLDLTDFLELLSSTSSSKKGFSTEGTISGKLSLSSVANSITVGTTLYEYPAMVLTVEGTEKGLFMKVSDGSFTKTEKDAEPVTKTFTLETDVFGNSQSYTIDEESVQIIDDGGYEATLLVNGVEFTGSESERDKYFDTLEELEFITSCALLKSTLSTENLSIEADVKNVELAIAVNLSMEMNLVPAELDRIDDALLDIDNLSAGSFKVNNLSVTVSNRLLGVSASLGVKNLSFSFEVLKDALSLSLSFDSVNLSALYSDSVKLSFSASNADISADVPVDEGEMDFLSSKFKASVDAGVGLKVLDNSIGLLVAVKADSSEGIDPSKMFTPVAATINGKYYDPEAFISAIVEVASTVFVAD